MSGLSGRVTSFTGAPAAYTGEKEYGKKYGESNREGARLTIVGQGSKSKVQRTRARGHGKKKHPSRGLLLGQKSLKMSAQTAEAFRKAVTMMRLLKSSTVGKFSLFNPFHIEPLPHSHLTYMHVHTSGGFIREQ